MLFSNILSSIYNNFSNRENSSQASDQTDSTVELSGLSISKNQALNNNKLVSDNTVLMGLGNVNASVGSINCFSRNTYITGKEKSAEEENQLSAGESLVLQSASLMALIEKDDLVIKNSMKICFLQKKVVEPIELIFQKRQESLKKALIKAAGKIQTLCSIKNLFDNSYEVLVDIEKLMQYRKDAFSDKEKYSSLEILSHSTLILLSAINKRKILEEKIITSSSRLNCMLFSFGIILDRNSFGKTESLLLSELLVLHKDKFEVLKQQLKYAPCSGKTFCIDMSPELKSLFGIA